MRIVLKQETREPYHSFQDIIRLLTRQQACFPIIQITAYTNNVLVTCGGNVRTVMAIASFLWRSFGSLGYSYVKSDNLIDIEKTR